MKNSFRNISGTSDIRELSPEDEPRIRSQVRLVMLITLSVFICEASVMLVISFLPMFSVWLHALLDATLLVMLLAPVLYFCLFRTLVRHIARRRQVEDELKKHRDHLEELVTERTAKLTAANRNLQKEISERKRAEAELTESEDRTRRIADRLPLLIASLDADRRYRFLNQEHERRYGISPPEFVGRKVADLIGSKHYDVIRARIDTVLSGKPVVFEEKIALPDGTIRPY